ncbi:hypothetical protein BS50DRAFT_552973 [Corynespora cassiicola Philippines]|uniref:DNA repair protein RAD50 n=1 Tax=Corynespora cassiicola Philippines TaxID=1448308 RepID=A0A2T2NNV3_CORCC|nr:hypothetical protein BS50DRAFT_552973 [Corynespora cassiicola Philippines]
MSRIDRLQITGIRSFGPNNAQTIQFQTPLTLIVGWNGSGKTTIIECLKYATTGELPPNSKTGGAFIHDVKLAGEKDVMAQVKLGFFSTTGARLVATRSMQLSIKKNTRSQKTLDGALKLTRSGHPSESISSRVAELDTLIPQFLGVSKAVLENVIFCHQEDSLWPMMEPSKLKAKFDEIFEADKYSKAVENIKYLRKHQNEELKTLVVMEKHAKEDREKASRARTKMTALNDECDELREQWTELQPKRDKAKENYQEAFDRAAEFESIIAQLNGKRITFNANKEMVERLEQDLEEMAESDEELQNMLDQYETRVAQYAQSQETLRGQYAGLKQKVDDVRARLGEKQSEIGRHEAEKEQHERNLKARSDLIKSTAQRHGIRGFDYEITDQKVSEFGKIIKKLARDQDKSVDNARQEHQEDLRNAQSEVSQLKERRTALIQSKDMARTQITTSDKSIKSLLGNMDQIQVDEGNEAILKGQKEETDKNLRAAISEADAERYDDRIREAEDTSRLLDEKKTRLENELVEATVAARDSAQIQYTQDELKRAKHSLETMQQVHAPRIAQIVDLDWTPATLDSLYHKVASRKAADVKEAESRRDVTQTQLSNINFRLSTTESEQNKKRLELQDLEEKVRQTMPKGDVSDFEEYLQELEEQYELTSSDQAKIEAQLDYMQSCLQVAKEHNQCRLCKRTLKDDKADHFTRTGFISNLENIVAKALQNAQAENTEELLAELEAARAAKPSYELAVRLRHTELPALKAEADKLKSERDSINEQLEEHDSKIDELQASQQNVDSLAKNVQTIVNYYTQSQELEAKLDRLTESQKAAGLSRTIDAVKDDLKKVNEEVRSAKDVLATLSTAEKKSRNYINSLELKIRDINAELNLAQSKLKEKRALSERIEELRLQNAKQRENIHGFDSDIQRLAPQIEQAQIRSDDVNLRGTEQIQTLQEEASKLADSTRQLADADRAINAYLDKDGPEQLSRTLRQIENLQGEIGTFEHEMSEVARNVKEIENKVAKTDTTKRSLSDNLRYREAKRALQTLATEIHDMESNNAEGDRQHYEDEGRKWQKEFYELDTQLTSVKTTFDTKDAQLAEMLQEWETDYKDADEKYRENHIKVETTRAAVEDLARYGNALEKAILKYHSLKMQEINRIIEELWRNSYQGTDVDTVKICSDTESARSNRAYNYRVVMVKSQTEMDMRGRCSAGQKVLASIIIRLALAECFGKNCGLIALDEPTTNLDHQNITGLANSLSSIIQLRRKQANFQLVVITHDEQFLREMNCAEYTDVYWRVGRDATQSSYIEKQDINEVS